MKYLQPVLIALMVAIISAAGGSIYRHELMIADQQGNHQILAKKLYRSNLRALEYHDQYLRGQIQALELIGATEGAMTIPQQAWVSQLNGFKEQVEQERSQAIEEGKSLK